MSSAAAIPAGHSADAKNFLSLRHLQPPSLPSSPLPTSLSPKRLEVLIDHCNSARVLLELHAAAIRTGHHQHAIVNFKLQRSYSSLRLPDRALALFRLTPDPNVFFWSSIIHAHVIHGLHHTALLLFFEMLSSPARSSPLPNAFTFSSVLKASLPDGGRAIHALCVKFSLHYDAYVATGILDMYARGGDVVSARKLFDRMPSRSIVSFTAMVAAYAKSGDVDLAFQMFEGLPEKDSVCWNTMINGYTQHGRPNDAVLLFRRMLRSSVKPNEVTILSVLAAIAQLGSLETGKWVHAYIINTRIAFTLQLYTALVDMYCKCGSLADACLVFDEIPDKDVVAWNSMIMGYAMHGQSREALRLFSEMRKNGVQPTDITLIGILNACNHAGLVTEGREIFSSIEKNYGISPTVEHYGCIVDLLGRAGFVEEGFNIVHSMAMKPDPVLWTSLLAACRLHKNMELAERIADFMVKKGLANSGTFVLLSNIYADI
ncbi:hypothetical protein HPP92_012511 [Vanilla planifolia]|uniref:Pentatricopeptide repeat-containing protein n=1 Tax=Vanilla planifolia TaxID=51239 RepID=A0A835R864_VANPL|nr:hypothetical protein HPP92_012511 [Vanilla planifolia]